MSSMELQAAVIQVEMRSIRAEAQHDVENMTAQAKQFKSMLTDWHYYVRTYPLWCAAAAAGLGFLMVPRREKHSPIDPAVLRSLLGDRGAAEAAMSKTKQSSVIRDAAIGLATVAAKSLLQGGLASVAQQMQGFMARRGAAATEEVSDHD